MADQEPQFRTLAERIAELNKQKNFQSPSSGGTTPGAASPDASGVVERPAFPIRSPSIPEERSPPLPTRPSASRVATQDEEIRPPLPTRPSASSVSQEEKGPALPTRPGTRPDRIGDRMRSPPAPTTSRHQDLQVAPAMPARRTSTQTLPPPPIESSRRNSSTSIRSNMSSTSTASNPPLRKLPPAFGETVLPALPPSKREQDKRAKQVAAMGTGDEIMSRLTGTASAKPAPQQLRLEDARSAAGMTPRLRIGQAADADSNEAAPPPIPLSTRPK